MENENLRRELEKKIRKHNIPPEYLYIAESLTHTKMICTFSKKFSEIPSTFLDLAKISYKLHAKMPKIKFTNSKEKQFVTLFRENSPIMRIKYDKSNDKMYIAQKLARAFGLMESIFDAVKGFSILENVSYVIADALKSESYDRMLFLLMTALTAGYGFGFDRVLFFEKDEKYLVGKKALGAFDEKEFNRLSVETDHDDFSFEEFAKHFIDDFSHSKLQRYLSSIKFLLFQEEGKFFDVKKLKIVPLEEIPPSLRQKLLIESDIVILPFTSTPKGSLFILDNKFTKREISHMMLRLLIQFYKEMELLLENFHLREELKAMAYNDELTGVKNRRTMKDINVSKGVLAMIDLDNFKYVNDTFGHEAGDKMLKKFTSLAKEALRSNDIILRYGGDEFLLIL